VVSASEITTKRSGWRHKWHGRSDHPLGHATEQRDVPGAVTLLTFMRAGARVRQPFSWMTS
jgi:hypothetical protein